LRISSIALGMRELVMRKRMIIAGCNVHAHIAAMDEKRDGQSATHRLRVGLVLGAGGPLGHAYHAGVLHALERAIGWDARASQLVVGTSAGAQVGALIRAGLRGEDLAARAAGEPLRPEAAEIARHYVRPDHRQPDPTLPKSRAPAAPRFLLEALKRPSLLRPGRLVSALLPPGRVRLDAQAAGLRRVFGETWPERPLWITAVHLDTGERVAFGAPGAPAIDVGTAVTCSGAVPGVHAPVHWEGRRYVDGGMASATHLDLVAGHPVDIVVVSSPLSMFAPMRALLRFEMRRIRGTVPVVAFEPRGDALRAMGNNPMALERSAAVTRAAFETTLRELDSPEKKPLHALRR
jgi:NTE family protein